MDEYIKKQNIFQKISEKEQNVAELCLGLSWDNPSKQVLQARLNEIVAFKHMVADEPAANVREDVQARWIKIYQEGEPIAEQPQVGVCCSKCMKIPKDKFTESNFCPSCGARMKG